VVARPATSRIAARATATRGALWWSAARRIVDSSSPRAKRVAIIYVVSTVPPLLSKWLAVAQVVALAGAGRFFRYERSRNIIYVSKEVAEDSSFPLRPGDALVVRIDRERRRLVVERAKP
jgi:hypothetical protein